jgi:hypothetical protein
MPERRETPAARTPKQDRKKSRLSSRARRDAEQAPRKTATVPRVSPVFVLVLLLVAGYLGLLAAVWLGYIDLVELLKGRL